MSIKQDEATPSDLGLGHLGLLMQVMGTIAMAVNVVATVVALRVGSGGMTLWLLAAIISGILRSLKHRQAGVLLATSQPGGWLAAKGYARISLFQIVGLVALAAALAPASMVNASSLVWFSLVFGIWPAAIYALIMRAPVRAAFGDSDAPPMPNDRGLQGAAVLMTTFGIMGVLFSVALALLIFPNVQAMQASAIILLLLWMAFTARSITHLRAGIGGINADHWATVAGIRRYESLSLLSVVVFITYGLFNNGGFQWLLTVALLVAFLMAWPMGLSSIVKSLPWEADDEEAPNGAALDDGRSALGFLLIASGVFLVIQVATGLLASLPVPSNASVNASSDVTVLASAVTSLWAGIELATFGARYRIAGTVYGVVGIVTTLIGYSDTILTLGQAGLGWAGASVSTIVAAQLALPGAVLWFVNRG